jgi:ketoreductase
VSARALEGRVAVVTGGSRGIGAAIATLLAERGAAVVVSARDADRLAAAVKDLEALGAAVAGVAGDVSRREDAERVVEAARERFGRLDLLVNNAGITRDGLLVRMKDEDWDRVMDVNLRGAFLMTRAVTKALVRQKSGGRIINIASTAGKQGVLLGAPYSASKHGVVGFTKALGKELAPAGITVNAVCPGYVETPLAERVRQGYAAAWDTTEQYVQEQFEAKIPLGRYTTPEEVAALVGYLTTEHAASITAQALNVCGGLGNV